MRNPQDPRPLDPDAVLDALLGGLSPEEAAAQADRLAAASPAERAEIERTRAAWQRLLEAERRVFEPAPDGGREARRVAAWIRDRVQGEENRAARARGRTPVRRGRQGWARLLAWSVGVHVVVLGILAFVLTSERPVAEEQGAHIALSEGLGFVDDELDPVESELARAYTQVEWRDVSRIADELVLREQETWTQEPWSEELPEAFENLPAAADLDRRGLFDQPIGLVAATVRRTDPALKRRRLDLLGFNAEGTLRAVERGLDYLAPRQTEDGSWTGVDRSDVEQTSLALLAFLGDGNASHNPDARKGRDRVVGRGIRWLRDRLFNASTSDAERAAHLAEQPVTALGPAAVALCEDYMLSYGWLSPDAAERRAREIAQLAARLQQTVGASSERTPAEALEAPWAVWGLDAAARVGVVARSDSQLRIFRSWVEDAAAAQPTLSAMSFLSVGTALLYEERGAQKPRFLKWSKENAKDLAARLGPGGFVRDEDPVGETALVLLGLQIAYRTY